MVTIFSIRYEAYILRGKLLMIKHLNQHDLAARWACPREHWNAGDEKASDQPI
jgi:hypothetical protein